MKVLHLLKTSDGARWAFRLMRELVNHGVDVHVGLPAGGQWIGDYVNAGVKVHYADLDIPARAPWRVVRAVRTLKRLVAEVEPAIVHSHFVSTTVVMRCAMRHERSIQRIFQVPGPLHLESSIFRTMERLLATPEDIWIPSCEWSRRRYLDSGIPPSRVYLSHYGLDVHEFTDVRRGALRNLLGLSNDIKLVGMVAFMYPPKWYLGQRRGIKGHEDLIDAMRLVKRRRRDVACVMIGGGGWDHVTPYERAVRRYADRKCPGLIHFLGTRRDIATLYPDLDVAVHPSHSENLGGVPESQLAGVPTIATAVGGFFDVIEPGVTGWLVPPRDPKALADAICEVLDAGPEIKEIVGAARTRARVLVDAARTAKEVLNVYQTILRQPAPQDGGVH